ncbi:MAG: hypothetical protein FJX75_17455 [Armatimonadetes bacterium]|nr:hypothetical protein [Armatimonadota bacterium]
MLLLAVVSTAAAAGPVRADPASPAGEPGPLKRLSRVYLVVHALNWLEITPDDPRRKTAEWEQWPGRCEICYQYEQPLKEKYYRLLSAPDDDTGVFFLPSGMKGDIPLIEQAKRTFGDRCVVCRPGYDPTALGEEFARGLEADRRRAEEARGTNLSEGEIAAWERSKAWAADLSAQLAAAGYTFDPARVKVIALGEDWCGCAATYPIHMGRAWGLREPVERRFDLMNPDCSPLLLKCTPVEQNVRMPENIRLFLFRSAEGRLVAQYWEGMHGLFDRPHVARVTFPAASARLIDVFSKPRGDTIGGEVTMSVGCGGHTPYAADLVQAEPGVSLKAFRKALVSAEIRDRDQP